MEEGRGSYILKDTVNKRAPNFNLWNCDRHYSMSTATLVNFCHVRNFSHLKITHDLHFKNILGNLALSLQKSPSQTNFYQTAHVPE